ncbi:hypothetical protein FNF29_02472 [Cafeteria roenbergensis]|uniref:Uncharacterized protein n=1 Tax=Cafeteria roenbergensis TaxID=33653 RepID=A0A5A8CMM3_CAFRO|nr:hypothetical protein FNF29_02472 [Cafeteria roenbergensis]|eukprot:KAA0154252.1 hypothetical protein FNF29_02472 [Cafeteria roenbergensis]
MDYSKIQTRAGPGGNRLHYMPSDAAITLANAYFGFDGWSCEVKETTIDSMEKTSRGFSVSACSVMRVTLRDGTYHEDVGTGTSTNMPDRAAATAKARKAAVSDARKRCLRLFHNNLGNCLRDQAFLKNLAKAKQEEGRRRVEAARAAAAGAAPFAASPSAVPGAVHERFDARALMGGGGPQPRQARPKQSPASSSSSSSAAAAAKSAPAGGEAAGAANGNSGDGNGDGDDGDGDDGDDDDAAWAGLDDEEALLALAEVEGTADEVCSPGGDDAAVMAAMRQAAADVDGDEDGELDDDALLALGGRLPFSQGALGAGGAAGNASPAPSGGGRSSLGGDSAGPPGETRAERNRRVALERQRRSRGPQG